MVKPPPRRDGVESNEHSANNVIEPACLVHNNHREIMERQIIETVHFFICSIEIKSRISLFVDFSKDIEIIFHFLGGKKKVIKLQTVTHKLMMSLCI